MSAELIHYIEQLGYLAIFLLVFLQEIGVPNPVPNEFILLFSGYLASIGKLSLPLTVLTVVTADFIGTSLLYFVFYGFGEVIMRKKPRWIPLSHERIEKLHRLLSHRDKWGIFLGRMLPYVRGYTSVAAGLVHIEKKSFLPMVFLSAVIWSGGYVVAGKIIGPYWEATLSRLGGVSSALFLLVGLVVLFFLVRHIIRHLRNKRKNAQL